MQEVYFFATVPRPVGAGPAPGHQDPEKHAQQTHAHSRKLLLRKRAIIETINDPLKNIQQIEHTRHRSLANAMVNVLAALVAYTHQPRKPSLNPSQNELKLVTCKE